LAELDKLHLEQWMLHRPEIGLQMLRVVSRRLRRTRADVADMIFLDVPARMAKLLLELASQFGVRDASGVRLTHGLTQAELAQLIGSSRETVNKSLSDFANRGWIRICPGSIVLVDLERLRRRPR
jgi:CRP-like cAMP-binding protein